MKQKITVMGKISNRSNPSDPNTDDETLNNVKICTICHCTFMDTGNPYVKCNLCRDTIKLAGGYKDLEILEPLEDTWMVKDSDGLFVESCTTAKDVMYYHCQDCGERNDDCSCEECEDCGCNDCECEFCDNCGDKDCEDCVKCDNCRDYECECVQCDACDQYECKCVLCEWCADYLTDENGNEYHCKCEDIVVP